MTDLVRPAHPGQFIRMEVIEPLGLSVTDAAKVLRDAASSLCLHDSFRHSGIAASPIRSLYGFMAFLSGPRTRSGRCSPP
jgi:hypothetical protein